MLCTPNKFTWQLLGWALLSAVVAIGVGLLQKSVTLPDLLRGPVALLPVLPMGGYFVGVTRWVRSLDEMQRLIQFEALLIQFGITALFIMGYGLLADGEVVPNTRVSHLWPWIWLVLFFSWSLGQVIVRRRYR
jgi:hypothetical protein